MTDRERGFLDAVLADPSDDFPRLVYADWLEDEGRVERAEFIRVQVELADMERAGVGKGKSVWKRHADALRRRERELWGAGAGDAEHWSRHFPSDFAAPGGVRRGFVASVSLPLADFMKHAGAIFGAAPVEEVRLTDREPRSVREWETWVEWRHEGDPSEVELDRLRRENRVILGEPVHPRYVIPHELFLFFAGRHEPHNDAYRRYRKPEIAHAALSLACVAFGRNLALPAKEAVSRCQT